MSNSTSLSQIDALIAKFNADRDWEQYHNPRNLAMALSVEASELLELFLWSSDQGPQPPVEGRDGDVADEAADVLICLLNVCRSMNIDLLEATKNKIAKNALKYPIEKSLGKLEKHDEI
jgi:NTP pyrophosphatase (non-canonical NTP hydrolase)